MVEPSLISIGLSGLTSARQRLETAAGNIVNANSAGTEESAFRPQRTVTRPAADGGVLARNEGIEPPFTRLFAPQHPEAGADGSVLFPNVSLAREIVEMKTAEISYKASARLLATGDELQARLIDILDGDDSGAR